MVVSLLNTFIGFKLAGCIAKRAVRLDKEFNWKEITIKASLL